MLHIASTYVLSAMKINWVVYKNQNRLTSRKFLHKIIFSYVITRYFFIKRIRLSLMPIYKISQSATGMLNAHIYSKLTFGTRNTPIVLFSGFRSTIFSNRQHKNCLHSDYIYFQRKNIPMCIIPEFFWV